MVQDLRFSAVTYAGTWYTNNYSVNSGGSSVLALSAAARATFEFNGTAASWIGYRDAWAGIANVYVDGALKTTVDTSAATDAAQSSMYSITGLTSGAHTLTIEVTGTRNTSAKSAWVWVDAFEAASTD